MVGLAGFHTCLIATMKTTNEEVGKHLASAFAYCWCTLYSTHTHTHTHHIPHHIASLSTAHFVVTCLFCVPDYISVNVFPISLVFLPFLLLPPLSLSLPLATRSKVPTAQRASLPSTLTTEETFSRTSQLLFVVPSLPGHVQVM